MTRSGIPDDLWRRELLKQREALASRGRADRAALREDSDLWRSNVADEAEASAMELQSEVDGALREIRCEAIAHIDYALARVDAGTYGVCEGCGATIEAARLRALPFAERCVTCARAGEARPLDRDRHAIARLGSLPLETGDDTAA